jgi:hypothetical protein
MFVTAHLQVHGQTSQATTTNIDTEPIANLRACQSRALFKASKIILWNLSIIISDITV